MVLVAEVAGSASAVGGVLVARLLPTLASPFAGVLADRLDRRAILVASDLARAVLVLDIVFAGNSATGLSPTFVFALGALVVAGFANGIDDVATNTLLQKRVPDAFLG